MFLGLARGTPTDLSRRFGEPAPNAPWRLAAPHRTARFQTLAGAEAAGMDYTGEWEPKTFAVPLQLSHGIVEADRAATCNDCHVPDGIMDFEALGYDDEHIVTLQSISNAEAGTPKTLQVDVIPDALPAEPKSDAPVEVDGSDNLPIFNTWTLAGLMLLFQPLFTKFLLFDTHLFTKGRDKEGNETD